MFAVVSDCAIHMLPCGLSAGLLQGRAMRHTAAGGSMEAGLESSWRFTGRQFANHETTTFGGSMSKMVLLDSMTQGIHGSLPYESQAIEPFAASAQHYLKQDSSS